MLNNASIIGRLTKDPEIRYTQSQKSVASFTVACDRDFKEADGSKGVDFIDCVTWNGSATYLEKYAHKGDIVAVAGRIQSRTWKDKDGNNRKTTEVIANNVYIIPSGKRSDESTPTFTEVTEDEGELPF